ncbi:PDR/VanB family oxidoreductase [Streptomyces sp. NPDC055722]
MPDERTGPDAWRSMLVRQVRSEAPRVLSLTLVDPAGGPVAGWEPGAHIDVALPSGIVRQYSLCGDDRNPTSYTVAVLHEPAGRGGSREVHTTALAGREVKVRGPRNRFPLAIARRHCLIAGGIGVTPILAMVRALEREGRRWDVLYCGHHGDMAFTEDLRKVNADRVAIVETDRQGRPDLWGVIGRLPAGTAVYCCGPSSLIADVTTACEQAGDGLMLRCERFAAAPAAAAAVTAENRPVEVRLARSGKTITVPVGRTILDAVRDIRPDMPFSCEEGYCGTCETRVLDGVPDHRDEVLGRAEHEQNRTMMICVSRAESDALVLDI